jgi:signal transduction histidine kinase
VLGRLNSRRVRVEEQHRRLEVLSRELAHRERLSAIGTTSSVLSHQILQQLGVVGIHADLVRHADADGDPAAALERARGHAAAIEEALRGVDRVLRDLLVFSRDPRLNLYQHDVGAVVAECVAECHPVAATRNVRLVVPGGSGAQATLDKLKVTQAVANLVRNAIEASPEGGAVEIAVAASGGEVTIAMADRGPGVAPEDRERLFTPFFTTKAHGTGLGLAIAREFVVAHGGTIAVRDRPGGGTVVEIRLPREPPAEASA